MLFLLLAQVFFIQVSFLVLNKTFVLEILPPPQLSDSFYQ